MDRMQSRSPFSLSLSLSLNPDTPPHLPDINQKKEERKTKKRRRITAMLKVEKEETEEKRLECQAEFFRTQKRERNFWGLFSPSSLDLFLIAHNARAPMELLKKQEKKREFLLLQKEFFFRLGEGSWETRSRGKSQELTQGRK